jgi:hypothetical protein
MSTSVKLPATEETWSPPAATALDEAVWKAWVAKGRAQERRSIATRIIAVKWAATAVLLGAAGFWSNVAPLEVVVRFLVTAGAMVLMFQAFQKSHHVLTAVFGALALLYNPVVPAFSFSGDWERVLVAASAIPFIASLVWPNARNRRTESND